MKKYRIISLIFVVLFALSISVIYINVPDTFIIYKDREWEIGKLSKVVNLDNSVEASKSAIVPRKAGDYSASLSIFGIPYKSVTLKVIEEGRVIPGGQTIGIRLYSEGLVVVAVGRVNENEKSPAEKAGIKTGDVITKINGKKITTPEDFSEKIVKSEGKIVLEVKCENEFKEVTILPEVSQIDNVKRVGLWVRDSTAGVGTLTFMNPENMTYGALGHGVSDSDTGVKFDVREGSIEKCLVGEIKKGEKGLPGELKGTFYSNSEVLGNIEKNETEGIFGKLTKIPEGEALPLGHKSEIKKGGAVLRTSLDGKDVKDYEIEILKVSPGSKNATKGMVIKVTDSELIEKTGGIVQGMSGSPIIQNGKLIGAVTHVLVNDPTKGYGIFIENMIEAGCN